MSCSSNPSPLSRFSLHVTPRLVHASTVAIVFARGGEPIGPSEGGVAIMPERIVVIGDTKPERVVLRVAHTFGFIAVVDERLRYLVVDIGPPHRDAGDEVALQEQSIVVGTQDDRDEGWVGDRLASDVRDVTPTLNVESMVCEHHVVLVEDADLRR